MTALWILTAITVWTLTGWAVVRLVLGSRGQGGCGHLGRLGLSIGAGVGAICVLSLWTNLIGRRFGPASQLVSATLMILPAAVLAIRTFPARQREGAAHFEPKRLGMLDWVLVFGIAAAVIVITIQATSAPLTQFDARVIWAFKAKVLYNTGTFLSENFCDPDRVHPHPRYPLLLPIAEAGLWQWTGRINEYTVKILSPLFVLALALVMADLLRGYVGRTMALVLTAVVAWCPMLAVHAWGATSGHADVPLAFFHTASTLLLARWLGKGSTRDAALAGLLAAFGIFTKNEGLALWAVNAVCAGAVILLTRDGQLVRGWLLFLMLPLVINAPWFVAQHGLPATSDEHYVSRILAGELRENAVRIPLVAGTLAHEIFLRPDRWSIIWTVVVLLTLSHFRRLSRPPAAMTAAGIVLYLAIIVVMFVVSPWEDVSRHMAIALPRLLLCVLPAAVSVIALVLGSKAITERTPSTE